MLPECMDIFYTYMTYVSWLQLPTGECIGNSHVSILGEMESNLTIIFFLMSWNHHLWAPRALGCKTSSPPGCHETFVGLEVFPTKLNWVVVSNIFYFHPYLGKIPILTNIFQGGWNHQLVNLHWLLESWLFGVDPTHEFPLRFFWGLFGRRRWKTKGAIEISPRPPGKEQIIIRRPFANLYKINLAKNCP